MISTSGILSTGEKKCRPMKRVGPRQASARPVIGSVEVLEAKARRPAATAAVFGDVGLDGAVFEHRLDDEIGVLQPVDIPVVGVMRAASICRARLRSCGRVRPRAPAASRE